MHIKRIGAGKPMAFRGGKKGKKVTGNAVQAGSSEPERITNKLEHTIVAESKPQRWLRARRTWQKISSHRRFKPAVIALVAIVVSASAIALYFGREKEQPKVADNGPKCTYAILEKTKPNLDAKNVQKLEPQVRDIEKIPGYDQDPNCLFVAVTYYINMSDAANAKKTLNKLEKAYDSGEGYETVISEYTKEPTALKPIVEFLEKQAAATKKIEPDGAMR